MALAAHRLWWPATLTAPARSTAVPAHRSSRSVAPTAGGHGGGGEPLRAAERFARRVHGDNDTAAGEGRKFPLSHVEVAVSYHHGGDGGRDSFERSIQLEGNLSNEERAQLMQAANMCPVGRTLGLNADIRTNDNVSVGRAASYDDDSSELPIPNIDPD